MSLQQALALWKSQISSYEKIIARCCHRIITPLTTFITESFQQKIDQFRQQLSVKEPQNYEQFIDVIVYFIEGKKNKSIIQLADCLSQELGGNLKYWQNIILDVAEQVSYTNQLSIWQVRKVFQQYLQVDPQNLWTYRKLCKLSKTYIASINNLIKSIVKFDNKKDSLTRIDDYFKKVKISQEKYISFCEQMNGFQRSNTFDQVSNNISQKSKQNALKDLFHYKQSSKGTNNQKGRKTLLNYNFQIKKKQKQIRVSGPTKNLNQINKQLVGQRQQMFQKLIKNIKSQQKDVNELRQLFRINRQKQSQNMKTSQINLTTIWDKDYFFSYIQHPIEMQKFSEYVQPFFKHQFINYEINSDDQYQDLIGQDVNDYEQMSQVSQLSRNSFVVSDDHFSEDQNLQRQNKQIKPTISKVFGQRWSFCKDTNKQKESQYSLVLIDMKARLPIEIEEKDQAHQILSKIIQGKDKKSIFQAISKQKIKISKAKIKDFLEKKCKTYVSPQNSSKVLYKVIQNYELQIVPDEQKHSLSHCKQDQNCGQNSSKADLDEDTNMFQNQYLSQATANGQRMMTRQLKKQSSQKLPNNNTKLQLPYRRSNSKGSRFKGESKQKRSI